MGVIYKQQGDFTKARDLYKKIGIPHMEKMMEGWIEELNKGSGS